MRLTRLIPFLSALLGAGASTAQPCDAVDFKTLPLGASPHPAELRALLLAYPGLSYDATYGTLQTGAAPALPLGKRRDRPHADTLKDANIAEQFLFPYPLDFDLTLRRTPYADPGRYRNDAFFRALYFNDKRSAKKSLATVSFTQGARADFQVTTKYAVDCQLTAAFAEIAASGQDVAPYFRKTGGSFKWRKIAGTERLSAHSFGIAIDLNTQLGQYWRWSGAKPGNAGHYDNKIPAHIVEPMERYGFIWGGKWHHFDGMHFEYRPELILYSRLLATEK